MLTKEEFNTWKEVIAKKGPNYALHGSPCLTCVFQGSGICPCHTTNRGLWQTQYRKIKELIFEGKSKIEILGLMPSIMQRLL